MPMAFYLNSTNHWPIYFKKGSMPSEVICSSVRGKQTLKMN